MNGNEAEKKAPDEDVEKNYCEGDRTNARTLTNACCNGKRRGLIDGADYKILLWWLPTITRGQGVFKAPWRGLGRPLPADGF